MSFRTKSDSILGLLLIIVGILAITVWIPADSGSGIIEKVRGKYQIGNALAPTVAFGLLIFAGLLLAFETRRQKQGPMISRRHLVFTLMVFFTFLVSLAVMRWAGPLLVSLTHAGSDVDYRQLRDTVPWKYVGFLTGGSLLVGTLIGFTNQGHKLSYFLIGFVAALLMIGIYDLPFDNLLLPPNGDV